VWRGGKKEWMSRKFTESELSGGSECEMFTPSRLPNRFAFTATPVRYVIGPFHEMT